MTDKNIQEAEVGSGTKIADTKKSEKRAQISLKLVQLRMKQEKERQALAAQKKSLQKEETMTESFSASQIAALKAEYSKINTVDPDSDTYKKLIAMLDRLDLKSLKSLAGAEIKFVSKLAQNRVLRKSMKKEAVDPFSLPNFKDLKSAIKHASDKVKTHRDQSDGIEIYKSRGGYDINHTSNSSGRDTTKKSGGKLLGIVYRNQKNDGAIYKNQYHNVIDSIKEEVESIDELSTNKLADYKKKAGENASAADKAGDIKKGNKRFSGIMKATRKQFDNDAKKTNEELSPKQKALDKNKNGKIDGTDLAHLRDKKKPQGADFAAQRRKERLASNGRMDEAKSDYEVYHKDYSGAVQAAIKQAEKRGFEVDMDDWHDKVATGPKKPSAGKTNSFSVKLKKDGKESKKALHLQVYNMDNHKYELNMYIEEIQLDELNKDTLHSYAKKSEKDQDDQYNKIGKGIRDNDPKSANKAGHKFSMRSIGQDRAEKRLAKEAASPAQQAAIAIAMKKAGKKPKDMEESDAYDKNVKPSDKPHDKEAAAKRAKLAALAARKKMTEGLMDKIKAIKRGMQAKDKADDHFDKAGDPKNANASKDLKKAVRYHNLLNKEEVVLEAKKPKSFKDVKKKMKEETPNKATVKKGEPLTGKREPIEVNPELKEEAK